jgi:hypothetical protein
MNYLRGAARIGLGTTIKYLRRTTSAAAGSDMGTMINYLRRTTSGAAGSGPGTTIKFQRRKTSEPRATAGRNDQVPATHNERRRGLRPRHRDQVPARRRRHWPGRHDQVPRPRRSSAPSLYSRTHAASLPARV